MHLSWIVLFGLFLKVVSNAGVARTSSTNSQKQPSRKQASYTQQNTGTQRAASQKKSTKKASSLRPTASLRATSNGQESLKSNDKKEYKNGKSIPVNPNPDSIRVLPINRNVNSTNTKKSTKMFHLQYTTSYSKSNDTQSCNISNVPTSVIPTLNKQQTVDNSKNPMPLNNQNLNNSTIELSKCSIPPAFINTTNLSTSSPTNENQNSSILTTKSPVNFNASLPIIQSTAPMTLIEINGNSLDTISINVSDKLSIENSEMDPLKGLLGIINGYDSVINSISIENVNFDTNKAEQLLKNLVAVQDLNASILKRFSSRLPFLYNDFIDYVDFLLFKGNYQKLALLKSIKKSKEFGKLLKCFSDDNISNVKKQKAALNVFSTIFDKEITNSFYSSSDICYMKNDFINFFNTQFLNLQRPRKNLANFLEETIFTYSNVLKTQIDDYSKFFTTANQTQFCESKQKIIKDGIEKFSFISDTYRNQLIEFFVKYETVFISSFNKKQLQKKLKHFLNPKKVKKTNLFNFFVPLKVSVVLTNCTVTANAFNNVEKEQLSIPKSPSMPQGIDSLIALLNSPSHSESKFEIALSVVTESTEELSTKKKKNKNIFTQCLC